MLCAEPLPSIALARRWNPPLGCETLPQVREAAARLLPWWLSRVCASDSMKPSLQFFYEDNPVQRYEPAFTLGEHAQDNCIRGASRTQYSCWLHAAAARHVWTRVGGSSVTLSIPPRLFIFSPIFFVFYLHTRNWFQTSSRSVLRGLIN